MFDAGRINLFAFCSNNTLPLSRDTILTPTKAEASSGLARMPAIRAWSSAMPDAAETCWAGLAFGVGSGVAAGVGETNGCETRRSRCSCCWAQTAIVKGLFSETSKERTVNASARLFLIIFELNLLARHLSLARRSTCDWRLF